MFDFVSAGIGAFYDDKEKCFLLNEKRLRVTELINYMLTRTQQIFVWEGLPVTIPERNLELLLQTCGNICITDVAEVPEGRGESGLYAMWGGIGGEPNAYYEPTEYIVTNPYLMFDKTLVIGKDCVWCRNDALGQGLLPMFVKYASMMNENEISLNLCSINYRIDNLISADNDRTYESAKKYLSDIMLGKLGVISSTEFFEGIKSDATGNNKKNIKDLIEYEQYLKASWFNEIGLNSNYNMKRERMVTAEAELTDDALIPLVENMLYCRQKMIEEVKELYGDKYDLSNLSVKLNAIWDLDNMYTSIPESNEENAFNDETEENEDGLIDNRSDITSDDGVGDSANNSDETIKEEETPEENPEDEKAEVNVEVNLIVDAAENIEVSERSETMEDSENEN